MSRIPASIIRRLERVYSNDDGEALHAHLAADLAETERKLGETAAAMDTINARDLVEIKARPLQ